MLRKSILMILAQSIVAICFFLSCSEENVTNPTIYVYDTTLVTSYDTVYLTDTLFIVDTVRSPLQGEWLRFSAYLASIEFVKENYPLRANDRFSSIGELCNYAERPAGRAGFDFASQGDSIYVTQGYTFEYMYGAPGFVWGAEQGTPTEKTYSYSCTMKLDSEGNWTLLDISLGQAGDYIRDTRHD
jgi:hypothetical protein